MAGLYVHVPFCAQACSYCDFHFTTKLGDANAMVSAICAELESALPAWSGAEFNTLYFGGGTPSVLGPAALATIAETAFRLAPWVLEEWTVEANPEDLDAETLQGLRDAGVNRLSIGVQSFDPDVLRWMNRIHSVDRAEEAIHAAADIGFPHLSIDLMYGLPVGGADRWGRDLERACALPVDHLSCYILTAEPRTRYGNQLAQGALSEPPDEQVVEEYGALCAAAATAGYEHYEVSNFGRPGGRSRHNSAYWDGTPYLGVGPGAHSFRNGVRWWNVRSNAAYMQTARSGNFDAQRERENLSATDRFNEALITGLRRIEGVCPATLLQETGEDLRGAAALGKMLDRGDCEWVNGRLRIPASRWPMGDSITLELMVASP